MRSVLRPVLACLLALVASSVFADGKYWPRHGVEVKPDIPYQRAIVALRDGLETLIVESVLHGEQGGYAWIVPIPAAPTEVRKVSPGLLETASRALTSKPVMRQAPLELVGALLLFLFLILGVTIPWRYSRQEFKTKLASDVLLLGLSYFLLAILTPVFAGGGRGVAMPGLSDLGTIGRYDVKHVQRPEALKTWMQSIRMQPGEEDLGVIDSYFKEGWSFMAMAVAKGQGDSLPHPLAVVFPSDQPVYPMRLTSLGTERLRLELTVIGPGTAEVPGMTLWSSTDIESDPTHESGWGARLRHPDALQLLYEGAVITHLRGEFPPEDLRKDFDIAFDDYRFYIRDVYDRPSAMGDAALFAFIFFTLGLYPLGFISVLRGWSFTSWAKGSLVVALACALGGSLWYMSLTKVDALEMRRDPRLAARDISTIDRKKLVKDANGVIAARAGEAYTKVFNRDVPFGYHIEVKGEKVFVTTYDQSGYPTTVEAEDFGY